MLRLSQETEGTAVRFLLDGAVTAIEATFLKQEVREAIAAGAKEVVLDLARTEFVDSTGLGAFVALHKSALETDCDFRLRGLGPGVRAVLELTRLHRVLRIEDAPRARPDRVPGRSSSPVWSSAESPGAS